MSCDIEPASPAGPLYRVGRRPDAWAWPDWAYAGPDGTFGNRFDDPRGEYRVLYASSERRGAFVEVLAPFRADPAVEQGLEEIDAEPGEPDDGPRPGQVPRAWLEGRAAGVATARGDFAAVGSVRSLVYLRERFGARARQYGIDELDAAAIRLGRPRAFTHELSRLVFECSDETGGTQFAGIAYRSRLGDEYENWALFEPGAGPEPLTDDTSIPVAPDDADLLAAIELLGLELV